MPAPTEAEYDELQAESKPGAGGATVEPNPGGGETTTDAEPMHTGEQATAIASPGSVEQDDLPLLCPACSQAPDDSRADMGGSGEPPLCKTVQRSPITPEQAHELGYPLDTFIQEITGTFSGRVHWSGFDHDSTLNITWSPTQTYTLVEQTPNGGGVQCEDFLHVDLDIEVASDDDAVVGTLHGATPLTSSAPEGHTRAVVYTDSNELRGRIELAVGPDGAPVEGLYTAISMIRFEGDSRPVRVAMEIQDLATGNLLATGLPADGCGVDAPPDENGECQPLYP